MNEEFDRMWKCKAVELAFLEELEYEVNVDLDKIFKRAQIIYDAGYEFNIKNWEPLWEDPKEGETKATVKDAKKVKDPLNKAVKNCPKCGDEIPAAWMAHIISKDKKKCGWKDGQNKES